MIVTTTRAGQQVAGHVLGRGGTARGVARVRVSAHGGPESRW